MSEQHSCAVWQLHPFWSLDLCPALLQVGSSVLQPKHQTSAVENRTESVCSKQNSPGTTQRSQTSDISLQAPGYIINHTAGWLAWQAVKFGHQLRGQHPLKGSCHTTQEYKLMLPEHLSFQEIQKNKLGVEQ